MASFAIPCKNLAKFAWVGFQETWLMYWQIYEDDETESIN